MTTWLAALRELQEQSVPAVLVTVAETRGSTPREAGARMLYSADRQYDTIGGGHLEWRAAQIARAMLADDASQLPAQRRLERIALGPSLGQCCGGVVFLSFERIARSDASVWQELETHWRNGADIWRALPLDNAEPVQLYETDGEPCVLGSEDNGLHATLFREARKTYVTRDAHGRRWLLDLCRAHQPQVVLFGAGHVGAAIVKVLSNLPCRVLWVDEREDMFPAPLPPQVTLEATDAPNAAVDMAEPGAYYLVMTHSHALDQQLTERILKRDAAYGDVGWFGLIGSVTKRRQFEHRLAERGFTQEQLNRMSCPIGIPGIYGKEPASIAIAVAAQLMQLWELRFTQPVRNKFPPALATHLPGGRG
jgi:xanthine dehydrogenase accessory factor